MSRRRRTTIDQAEVDRFTAMAAEWWNPAGKFKPLHKFNPVRIRYIRDKAAAHFGARPAAQSRWKACVFSISAAAAGLLSEPMARMGATVIGADASERNIGIASTHAAQTGVNVDYRAVTAEQLAAEGENSISFSIWKVVEHVSDVDFFISTAPPW